MLRAAYREAPSASPKDDGGVDRAGGGHGSRAGKDLNSRRASGAIANGSDAHEWTTVTSSSFLYPIEGWSLPGWER